MHGAKSLGCKVSILINHVFENLETGKTQILEKSEICFRKVSDLTERTGSKII